MTSAISKTIRIPLMGLVLAGCAVNPPDQRVSSLPEASSLVGHWVCEDMPVNDGLLLKKDGEGSTQGSDPRNPGTPLRWRVTNEGVLDIMLFGEEGEHGSYESFSYEIRGKKLILNKPLVACDKFQRLEGLQDEKH
jgi:hypothetical protein